LKGNNGSLEKYVRSSIEDKLALSDGLNIFLTLFVWAFVSGRS
jgi:hypothetical protein